MATMSNVGMSEGLASLVEAEVGPCESFAEQVEANEWASAASVVHNEEERAAVMQAAKKAKYKFSRQGSSFSLERSEDDETIIEGLIKEGKETPYTKGPGGSVQHLDGTESPARSKVAGVPLPWYSWNAVPIDEDVHTKLTDLIPQMFQDLINKVEETFTNMFVVPAVQEAITGGAS